MSSITFVALFLSLIISVHCKFFPENNPIIVFMQGVIADKGLLPISIYWDHPNLTEGDRLLVHYSNPKVEYWKIIEIESYTGFYDLPQTALGLGRSPDNYCAAILIEEDVLDNNPSCKSKLQWMYDRKDKLGGFSLTDLVIPGTHHSAAYTNSENETLDDQSLIARWMICQTKSIKSQLIDGIRYLDLRPGIMYNDGKVQYIVTHNIFNLISMDEVVKQINEFMDLSKDILIVSLKEFFKGFDSYNDHVKFIRYLENSLGRHAYATTNWRYAILHEIWSADKRLIISYDHNARSESSIMWPPITQWWSNAQTISKLHSAFDSFHQGVPLVEPRAEMVELTHSFTTIVQDALQGDMSLRHWAERLSRYIPRWYTEEWNRTANIIAVDFYQTSGIVDLAIQLNDQRARYRRSRYRK